MCVAVAGALAAACGPVRAESPAGVVETAALASTAATEPIPAPPASHAKFIGVSSCASSGCHGGNLRNPDVSFPGWQSSYSVWATYDKHNRAYQVLGGPKATAIVNLLNAGASDEQKAIPAALDVRCIGCHSTPGHAESAKFVEPDRKSLAGEVMPKRIAGIAAEGISCESCHGAAEKWVFSHTLRDRSLALRDGLTDTDDLAALASNCVKCHVGAPPEQIGPSEHDVVYRDMNHDMIAAGHPRLTFEFSTYMALMPRHWREPIQTLKAVRQLSDSQKEALRTEQANLEYRRWEIGQAVAMAALLELSAHRADRARSGDQAAAEESKEFEEASRAWRSAIAKNSSAEIKTAETRLETALNDFKRAKSESAGVLPPIWPEFSEYDCFRCHHGFRTGEPKAAPPAVKSDDEFDSPPEQSLALERKSKNWEVELDGFHAQAWSTWGSFHRPATQAILSGGGEQDRSLAASVHDAVAQICDRKNSGEELQGVANSARAAAQGLRDWAARRVANRGDIDSLTSNSRKRFRETAESASTRTDTWDRAAQSYLTCVAMIDVECAAAGNRDAEAVVRDKLLEIFAALKFGERFESPAKFDVAAVRRLFAELARLRP